MGLSPRWGYYGRVDPTGAAISAMENGRQRVPPERYEAFARALDIDAAEFAKTMLRYDNPEAWRLMFGKRGS